MEQRLVAGERVDLLREALQKLEFTKVPGGDIRVTGNLPIALGTPLARALTRIDRELGGRGRGQPATRGQVQADALVILATRVSEASKTT